MKNVVLITRPEDDAADIAYAVNQKKFLAFCEPFLNIVFEEKKLSDLEKYGALIFTSANGVRAFYQNSDVRNIPAFCVGENTLEEVRKGGFDTYRSARGNIDDLIEMLEGEEIDGPYLYIRGKEISKPLVDAVPGKQIEEQVLYHTEIPKKMTVNCVGLIKDATFSHVMFFSKRTAETFAALIDKEEAPETLREGLKSTKALCLGDSMIECLSVLPWEDIKVAERPDRDGILDLLDKEIPQED